MSTINTNIAAFGARRNLAISQHDLSTSLERLSSGLKINRGADNPAGLIVSERLRAEIAAVGQAIDNSSRAINVIATTEGALNEVSALLIDINGLVVEAASTGAFSDAEMEANQLQIDSAIDSIARIANTTTFAGRKLLNGELDYVTSGVVTTELKDVNVQAAKFGRAAYVPVTVDVSQSALQAQLAFSGPGLNSAVTINLSGPDGIITLSFPASASTSEMVESINNQVDSTGVTAVASGTGGSAGMRFQSVEYGSDAFVSVTKLGASGAFEVMDTDGVVNTRDEGVDALATINGAATIANGLKLKLSTVMLKVEMNLAEDFGQGTTEFAITEGGALFQLGPQVTTNLQENIGVKAMHPEMLGNALVGYLNQIKSGQSYSLRSGNFKQASDILDEVSTQVSVLRGRLGSFERNTLRTNINQLQITVENLTSSESVIRDTDFAAETSELTRAQILVQAGTNILAIANAQSQNVLTLLGG